MYKLTLITYIGLISIILFAILSSSTEAKSINEKQIIPKGVPLPTNDYVITAYFHDQSYYEYFHEWHTGIDMVPSFSWYKDHPNEDVILHSTIDGIGYIYTEQCSGNAAIIVNKDYTIYLGHVSKFLYPNRDSIHFGQEIAVMGQSGELGKCVTGPHVHYQIYKTIDGKSVIVDPIDYLN